MPRSGNTLTFIAESAAQAAIKNNLAAADTQPAFQVNGDGKHQWGPGGSTAPDTSLYRSAANTLKTDGSLFLGGPLYPLQATNAAWLAAAVVGDTNYRFTSGMDGSLNWGPGTAAQDVNLYRSAAATLTTDSSFQVGGALRVFNGGVLALQGYVHTYDWALTTALSGDTGYARYVVTADGTVNWGPGNVALDTNLYRSAANTLRTDGTFISAALQSSTINGTSYIRANQGLANGEVVLGYSGSANAPYIVFGTNGAWDTNLYRSAAGVLKTDGVLNAVGGLQVNGVPVSTASDFVLIQTISLGSAQSSIDFTGIPSTYRTLELRGIASGATATFIQVRFNGDSGNNYNWQGQFTSPTNVVGAYNGNPDSWIRVGQTGGVWNPVHADIYGYAAAGHKAVYGHGFAWDGTRVNMVFTQGWWNSGVVVNRVTLHTADGSNFQAGSTVSLYGRK